MNSVALMTHILVQILSKVDNCVLQVAIAALSFTLAACLVLLGLLSSAHFEITREPSTTLHALLKVLVTVDFGYLFRVNTTFEMETVNVLANNTLQDSSVLKFNKGHVRNRWPSLLNCLREGDSMCEWQGLALPLAIFLKLLLKGGLLPAAGTCLQHCVVT